MGFELTFDVGNRSCKTELVEGKGCGPTVSINGKQYTVVAKDEHKELVARVIPKIQAEDFASISALSSRISQWVDTTAESGNLPPVGTSHKIGLDILSPSTRKETVGSLKDSYEKLPVFQREVAEQYWDKYVANVNKSEENHSGLKKELLVPAQNKDELSKNFDQAISQRNKELFCKLFNHLEYWQLYRIVAQGGLDQIRMPDVKPGSVDLSKLTGLEKEIKGYIDQRGFSGVVALSDGNHRVLIASDQIKDPSTPMSVHSVGKICTGLLALRLIEEGVMEDETLEKPIELDKETTKYISLELPAVHQRLSEVKMIDLMHHKAGLDDYLGNYEKAIQEALDKGQSVPSVTKCEDLLKYANDELLAKGEFHYSNLGLLLVGLSLQHHVSKHKQRSMSFDDALKEYVLIPAKIDLFSPLKPGNGVNNPNDEKAAFIYGGPGGGHWSTASDMLNLGDWVGKNSDPKSRFGELLEKYGGEFYNNGDLWHAGSISSASAHLTHLGNDKQLTIAALSNTTGFSQATTVAEAVQDFLIT